MRDARRIWGPEEARAAVARKADRAAAPQGLEAAATKAAVMAAEGSEVARVRYR